jgi:manganese transport system ATP-binding protein
VELLTPTSSSACLAEEGPNLAAVTSAIRVEHLEVRYGREVALTGVDLDIAAGSSLAVIGPNGSGKSTLLNALAGVVPHDRGTFVIEGDVALVLQSTDVDRSLPITVRETVDLARYPSLGLFRRFGTADRAAVAQALERVGMAEFANRQFHDLSGGQRQRVLFAQGLAQEADILLLDEPVTGLDLVSRSIILDIIDEEVAAGHTVVMTTHDLEDARRCSAVLILDTTPIVVGPPDEALTATHLRQAFGRRTLQVGDALFLDDPHHSH